jgi:hypothetical protein
MEQTKKELWRLIGHDTFDGDDYPLTDHASEEEALRAAHDRLRALEVLQPEATSGGQDGIQDRVYVVRPNGTRYRVCLPD